MLQRAPCVLFLALTAARIYDYPSYTSKALWVAETLSMAVLALVYAIRIPARIGSATWLEHLIPWLASALPFCITWLPFVPHYPDAFWALVLAGEAITIVSVATLGRSFGIRPAVRQVVSRGIYRYVRHPVYTGEILTTLGLCMLHAWPAAWLILAVFVILQSWRARMEEAHLAAASADYAARLSSTGMFLPRLRAERPGPQA
ncbi:MAG: methyltransferase family protein [Candidatus Xenobia bacterium]